MSTPFVAVAPGPDLSEAELALLVRVAWSRARARMLAALAVIAAGALAIGAVTLLHAGLGAHLVSAVCALVLAAAVVTAVRMPAEQSGLKSLPLMSGADRTTRKVVLRSVRRGVRLSGRLGVLADDCARRIVRRRCVPITYGLLAVAVAATATLMPATLSLVLIAGALVLAGAAATWIVLIGQARRYLDVDPAPVVPVTG